MAGYSVLDGRGSHQREQVVLEFQDTWAETGGKIATLIGVLGLIGVGIWGVRRRQA